MKDKKTKRDLLLVLGILVFAGGFYLVNQFINRAPGAMVKITVDGQVVEMLDLSEDTDTIIESFDNNTNHLIIKDKKVWISEASCPNKDCIKRGKIWENGEYIACLPNQMIAIIVEE